LDLRGDERGAQDGAVARWASIDAEVADSCGLNLAGQFLTLSSTLWRSASAAQESMTS
jgi:hypothetical protein